MVANEVYVVKAMGEYECVLCLVFCGCLDDEEGVVFCS